MFAQVIIYIFLGVMSLTAAYAATTPVAKPAPEQREPAEEQPESGDSL